MFRLSDRPIYVLICIYIYLIDRYITNYRFYNPRKMHQLLDIIGIYIGIDWHVGSSHASGAPGIPRHGHDRCGIAANA